MGFPKLRLLLPVAAVLTALIVPSLAPAEQVPTPSGGKTAAHPAGQQKVDYRRKKKKKRKKKHRQQPAATAPTAPTTPAAPYLISFEEGHAAISAWAASIAGDFQRSDSWYGDWYWDVDEPSCGWNYYSGTRSLTCTTYFYDYNPDYCHFYFHTANTWSAHQWTVTARPTVPGSHSITIGNQYELRFYECYST